MEWHPWGKTVCAASDVETDPPTSRSREIAQVEKEEEEEEVLFVSTN
jgi:hypothetical protein